MLTNPDWKQPLPPYSPNEGVIEGNGILTFDPWATRPSSAGVFSTGSLRAFVVFLQLLAEPTNIDINVNFTPHKLYLGRVCKMQGNFVLEDTFINHRNVVVNFFETFSRYWSGATVTMNSYVFQVDAYFGGTVFDIHEVFDTAGVRLLVSAPIFQLGYDLQKGVKFRYVWL